MDRNTYREEYLRSEHWRTVRQGALERADHRCQVCNGDKHLDVHHRTYERLGAELDHDLTVLCRTCHSVFHDRKRNPKKPAKSKRPSQSRDDAFAQRREYALAAIRENGPMTTREVARLTGMKVGKTGAALAWLRNHGRLQRSGDRWSIRRWPNEES